MTLHDPPLQLPPDPGAETSGNGHKASHGDFFQIPTQSRHDPAEQLFSFPTEIAQFVARSVVNDRERMAIIAITGEDQMLETGSTDYSFLAWLFMGLKISEGGRGRNDFLRALIQHPKNIARRVMDRVKETVNRTVDGQEE